MKFSPDVQKPKKSSTSFLLFFLHTCTDWDAQHIYSWPNYSIRLQSRSGVAEWLRALCCSMLELPPMLVETWSASMYIKKAWLPFWPPRGKQVSHQRFIRGIHCMQVRKLQARDPNDFETYTKLLQFLFKTNSITLHTVTVIRSTYKTMVFKIVTFTTADETSVSHVGFSSPLKENKNYRP